MMRIGCVSYLNAKPLIHGLDSAIPGAALHLAPPSALLEGLEDGRYDLALCPVIDLQRSRVPLEAAPVGGIGCDGPTLTVRLLARRPLDRVRRIAVDPDSHTSVALLRVLWRERYGRPPELAPLELGRPVTGELDRLHADAALLIGDKVVTADPGAALPHQLDLGEQWRHAYGLPFVFAVWMARRGADLGDLPCRLDVLRQRNADRLDEVVATYAAGHGWPDDLARRYLGSILRYAVGPRELAAIDRFFDACVAAGVIESKRPWAPTAGRSAVLTGHR